MADPDTRIYGMADSSNHQAPGDNGMRGEGAADRAAPGYHRTVDTVDEVIVVEEVSGVAYAEALRPAPGGRDRAQEMRSTMLPWILVALVLGYAAERLRREEDDEDDRDDRLASAPPAALARPAGEQGGFSQVRDAGPEAIRDPQPRWSEVDEASDESFPASDPPSFSMPGR
ncbi:hypothetical protein [Sphingomonas sp. ABOLG]|uniref:hypothetical protein n=1 Tax=Sphingomonas sp. ABOLG TaxID=1985880 RepID=UPI0026D1EC5E